MHKNLRSLRNSAGFTQESLSAASGVGASTIGNYETGRANMSEEMLRKLAETLNTTIDFLKEEEGGSACGQINEEFPEYRTRGLEAINTNTMQVLLDESMKRKDWSAVELFAGELKQRENAL